MRPIDADELKKRMCFKCNDEYSDEPCEPSDCVFCNAINDAPTLDAVPVVRCRDCKHHRDKNEQEQQYLAEDILICTSQDATEDCWNAVWPDHFCSYGEKECKDGTVEEL